MSNEDAVIAKALNAGLRRLLVAAFIHEQETAADNSEHPTLYDAINREIGRLAMRGKTDAGEDVELTAAVRNGLKLYLDAAWREASGDRPAPAPTQ